MATPYLIVGTLRICKLSAIRAVEWETRFAPDARVEQHIVIMGKYKIIASFVWLLSPSIVATASEVGPVVGALIERGREADADVVIPAIECKEQGFATIELDVTTIVARAAVESRQFHAGFRAALAVAARRYAEIADGADGNGLDGYEEVGAGKLLAALRAKATELKIDLPKEEDNS